MSRRAKVKTLPTRSSNEIDFNSDESKLLVIGSGELSVFELPGGELLKRSKISSEVIRGVFDPSGRFALLVLVDELVLFDWQRGKRLRRWKLGERIDNTEEIQFLQQELQSQLSGIAPEDFEKHFRKMAQQLGLPADKSKGMLAEARQQHENMKAMLQSPDWAEQAGAVRGSESPVAVCFNRDGRLLLCATDQGPRVYRWAEFPGVLEALESPEEPQEERSEKGKKKRRGFQFAPAPLYAVEGEAYQEEGEEEHYSEFNEGRYIYAMAYDAHRERFVYGGMGGVIGCLDLANGEHRTLAELPGRPTIDRMALSLDGSKLACTTQPQFYRDPKKLAAEVCVWDYQALLGA
jgi:hypothetical protein